jgi:predicted phosphodiesterase
MARVSTTVIGYNARVEICIVSDSHDRADALRQAVSEAKEQGAAAVIHCGDLIGANMPRPAMALGLPLHVVHGNNLGDLAAMRFEKYLLSLWSHSANLCGLSAPRL